MSIISSSSNGLIKDVNSLKLKKYREEKKQFLIEGIRFVDEAIREKVEIVRVLISEKLLEVKGGKEILGRIKAGHYETFTLSDKLIRELSDTENPQGILAVVSMRSYELCDIIADNSFIIVIDSLQDPGNMGTIVRTADAAGATGIVFSKGCVDLYNPKVLRSTMGSIFHIPLYFSNNLTETIDTLKAKKIKTYAAHLKGEQHYFNINMRDSVALIIGNEANGISDEVSLHADALVKIPMPGKSESLNASVAASLLMYEVVRQRMSDL